MKQLSFRPYWMLQAQCMIVLVILGCSDLLRGDDASRMNVHAAAAPTRGADAYGVDNPAMLSGEQSGESKLLRGALTALRSKSHNDSAVVFQYLARDGNAAAQHFLGTLYLNGWGVEQSIRNAYTWFAYSAHQGVPVAEYRLGLAFFRAGEIQDALTWWQRSADQAHVPAQYNLGLLYLYGVGVETDFAKAAALLESAARRGSPGAQFYIGMMYLKGQGYAEDRAIAAKWFEKSATAGFVLSEQDIDSLKQNYVMPLFAR